MNLTRRVLDGWTGLALCFVLAGVATPQSARAGEPEAEPAEKTDFVELTPKQDEAIEKGTAWLVKNQNSNGSWGSEGKGGTYTMAMTGLAGLALLSAGHLPGRGKYGSNVARALEYCLKNTQKDGLIYSGNDGQQMYGHGFAMTFMGEAHGMDATGDMALRIKEALARAVVLSGKSQSSQGGWYYSPNSGADEGSVTITQVQALRSVRNAGIDVPVKLMEGAINYVKKCQNADGGIRYSVQSGQTSSPALSAAGAEVFMMAGRYDKEETKKVIEYLKKNLNPRNSQGYHDFYTNFYGAQAMYQIGGEHWQKYYTVMRDRLLSSQNPDGSWRGEEIGSTYRTAIAVMILSIPYRYLPIFQK